MRKIIYIGIGFTAFSLGAVGTIVPILPTTPFLLIAAFCFVRGSERIHEWFVNSSLYKKHLESFIKEKRMSKKKKIYILSLATVMLLIPCILIDSLLMRIGIGVVLSIKWYYFIFIIKTEQ